MDKSEADRLSKELGELSENEEKNMERMKEIARILVDFYMPNKNKTGEGWNVRDAEKKSKESLTENTAPSVE